MRNGGWEGERIARLGQPIRLRLADPDRDGAREQVEELLPVVGVGAVAVVDGGSQRVQATSPESTAMARELKRRGELTVRVFARPTLDKWNELAYAGISPGFGDDWIRIRALKGFVDGIQGNSTARFYEPDVTERALMKDRERLSDMGFLDAILAKAVPLLADVPKHGEAIRRHVLEIHRLENEGDRISRDGVASLFANGIDPMVVIRWKDIFERLEEAIDATEHVANILEGIVIKNS